MKYMMLVYLDEQAMSEAEREKCYVESAQLARDLSSKGKYLSAGPLHPVAMATSVRVRNGKRLVTDGPFAETRDASIELKGAHTLGKTVSVTRLTSGSADDINSFETPEAVSPRQLTSEITGSKLRQELPPNSLTILRVPAQGAVP